MIGLAQPLELRGTATQPVTEVCPGPSVLGLVVSRSYPDLDALPAQIEALTESGTVWVAAATDLEAKRLLERYEPILLPLVPAWRLETVDLRRQWRDCELLHLCSHVYVFQKTGAKTQWNVWNERGVYGHLTLTEAGGRNPPTKRRYARPAS